KPASAGAVLATYAKGDEPRFMSAPFSGSGHPIGDHVMIRLKEFFAACAQAALVSGIAYGSIAAHVQSVVDPDHEKIKPKLDALLLRLGSDKIPVAEAVT